MVYELRKIREEIPLSYIKKYGEIEGVTVNYAYERGNLESEVIEMYNDLDAAKAELDHYTSSVTLVQGSTKKFYVVEEYYIEENLYNADGDWIDGGDIIEFSRMPSAQ